MKLLYKFIFLFIVFVIFSLNFHSVNAQTGCYSFGLYCDMGSTTLTEGSTGFDVSNLQAALNVVASANLATDGHFGPHTYTAVTSFQASRGLAADGLVGSVTKGAINTSLEGSNANNNFSCPIGYTCIPPQTKQISCPPGYSCIPSNINNSGTGVNIIGNTTVNNNSTAMLYLNTQFSNSNSNNITVPVNTFSETDNITALSFTLSAVNNNVTISTIPFSISMPEQSNMGTLIKRMRLYEGGNQIGQTQNFSIGGGSEVVFFNNLGITIPAGTTQSFTLVADAGPVDTGFFSEAEVSVSLNSNQISLYSPTGGSNPGVSGEVMNSMTFIESN